MLRLIIILTIGFHTIGLGQTFTGQVFMIAEGFSDDKCEVFAECDCCSSDIFFLSANRFCFVSRCISGDSYFTGTYSTKSDKLKLTLDKTYVYEITDEDYTVTRLETKMEQLDPIEFEIVKCGQKVRLTHPTTSEWKNGGRYELKRETELLKELTTSKPWKQLSK